MLALPELTSGASPTLIRRKMKALEKLTFESVTVRAVSIPMRRPIVAKVGTYTEWPFILIDVHTKEGITGRAYLEPYLKNAVRYIGPAIEDMAAAFKGRQLAPLDMFRDVIGTLHLLGRQGVSMIAAAGLDMAIWDALAKAAGLPLAEMLGGTVGKIRTYNTNGLWLLPPDKLALATEIAAMPMEVRGFGHVKEAAVARYRASVDKAMQRYVSGQPQVPNAA